MHHEDSFARTFRAYLGILLASYIMTHTHTHECNPCTQPKCHTSLPQLQRQPGFQLHLYVLDVRWLASVRTLNAHILIWKEHFQKLYRVAGRVEVASKNSNRGTAKTRNAKNREPHRTEPLRNTPSKEQKRTEWSHVLPEIDRN